MKDGTQKENKMRKTIIILLVTIGLIYLFMLLKALPETDTPSYSEKIIADSVYLKTRIWGNEQLAIITQSSKIDLELDSNKDYIFDLSSPVFYKNVKDSIIIYTYIKTKVPQNFKSKIKVVQIELSNPKMMDLIKNQNYIKLGLKKME